MKKQIRSRWTGKWGAALILGMALGGLSSCGKPEDPADYFNRVSSTNGNPYPGFNGTDVKGERNFAYLINNYTEGKPARTPWAGYWWPYSGNGIAAGQFTGGLSPSGKYDAARGHQTNAQAWEIKNHGAGVKGIQQWWGHCNGWCVAAGLMPEPREDKTVNGITFGVADQKALLAEAGMSASADFFGNRVDTAADYESPKYTDTVPDQYFLVLANYMGIHKQAILIDRYTGDQIWNQPVVGYHFDYPTQADYLGASPDAPGVYRVILRSTIVWAEDGVEPDVQTPDFDFSNVDGYHFNSRDLVSEIWLDGPVVFGADGKIKSSGDVVVTRQGDYYVGGAWRMGDGYLVDAWPDYMWVPYSFVAPDPNDDYSNPQVDIAWLEKYMLNGTDDPSATGGSVEPAPSPASSRSSHDSDPAPSPSHDSDPAPSPSRDSDPVPFPSPSHSDHCRWWDIFCDDDPSPTPATPAVTWDPFPEPTSRHDSEPAPPPEFEPEPSHSHHGD